MHHQYVEHHGAASYQYPQQALAFGYQLPAHAEPVGGNQPKAYGGHHHERSDVIPEIHRGHAQRYLAVYHGIHPAERLAIVPDAFGYAEQGRIAHGQHQIHENQTHQILGAQRFRPEKVESRDCGHGHRQRDEVPGHFHSMLHEQASGDGACHAWYPYQVHPFPLVLAENHPEQEIAHAYPVYAQKQIPVAKFAQNNSPLPLFKNIYPKSPN